ncbi:hypothetical protein GUB10_12920 [Salegentibacter sp. BLCTC]|uniref:Uncharacterized protein n=1 Tax=Salegentibacter maritimus TaxID=2794347 RepID=A0ABS0TI22_9FLAO|nr:MULTISPECIES: DUF6095 family protein [Salegentibacter]MBE7641238.1 hypothetical protein [Salegentibacter sp. BLCTC]MBI6120282.1 hypothetical protein [Salegentibacter maritimus]
MKHTDKKILGKGIKYLAFALPLILIGPSVLFTAFNNQDHPYYIPVLILGIIALIAAMLLLFKGIMTIVKAVFD